MRSLILAIAAGAALAVSSFGAEAAPVRVIVAPAAPEVILVGGGCGPGFHRTPGGFCARNFYRPAYGYGYGPGYYRPYARCGIRVGPIGIGAPC